MKHRLVLAAMAAVAVLGTGAAVAAGPAQAAPAISAGTYYFFVTGTINCITTHGVGNQLTVSQTGTCAKITVSSLGNDVVTFADGNGNCLRANNSDVVLVENGRCNTQDSAEVWTITHVGYRFENDKQALWMKVTGTAIGDKVWVGTGGLTNWQLAPLS
jgi:hypothetical protein